MDSGGRAGKTDRLGMAALCLCVEDLVFRTTRSFVELGSNAQRRRLCCEVFSEILLLTGWPNLCCMEGLSLSSLDRMFCEVAKRDFVPLLLSL